jgi:hypothetical protein
MILGDRNTLNFQRDFFCAPSNTEWREQSSNSTLRSEMRKKAQ